MQPIRLITFLSLLSTILLTSCANDGLVVQKEARPFPLYLSLGLEDMYTFLLRDQSGSVRRQMVTAEVFERYAVGDYFDDLQLSSRSGSAAYKETATSYPTRNAARFAQKSTARARVAKVAKESARQIASGAKSAKSHHLANKTQPANQTLAQRASLPAKKSAAERAQLAAMRWRGDYQKPFIASVNGAALASQRRLSVR